MTINKVCGSGLKAVHLAMQAVACGDADIVIAGGQESMSQSAHVLPRSREGQRMGDWAMKDTMIVDGLWDAFNKYHMGVTAENIAKQYAFTREAQDAFAAGSQQKAEAAIKSGRFKDEIIPVSIPQRKGDPLVFDTDEFPRAGTTAEGARQAASGLRQGRHGDRRQCLRHQRRRGHGRGDEGVQGQGTGSDPDGASGRLRERRRGSGHHGHRPHPGLHQVPGEGRLDARPISI